MNSLKMILMSSAAAISLAAAPALAQETPDPLAPAPAEDPFAPAEIQAAPEVIPRTYEEVFGESLAGWEATHAEELLGKTVVDDAGEKLGDIDSFALADERIVAILGTGGFLGLGKHKVAIPVEQLTVTPDQLILSGVTREDLRGLPEWDASPDELVPDGAVTGDAGGLAPMAPTAEPMAPVDAPVIAADAPTTLPADTVADDLAHAADDAGAAIEGAADDAAADVADAARDAGAAIDEAAEDIAGAVDEAMEPMSEAVEGDTEMVADEAPVTPVAPAATDDFAADDAGGWTDEMDIIFADIADRQIAELIGMPVASAEGEVVGEVDNFVLDGNEIAAIVGVGGFLGLGEHDVALSLDEMTFDGERLVLSSITGDQLREMPEYDDAGAAFLPQEGTLRSTYDAQ